MKNVTEQAPAYSLKVEIDDLPPNPRTDYDNFGHMVCWHSQYALGDKHNFPEPSEFLKQLIDADNDSLNDLSISELKELADKKNVILPLYLYDHSGLSISCSHSYPYNDRWDAGQVGWIYAGHDKIKKEYGVVNEETVKQAKQLLISETETYDNYLRGECYGYVIEKDGVEVDSCWGFLGDFKEMLSEMKEGAGKEYQRLFDHIDYGCMEYTEDKRSEKAAKPSIRKQLTGQINEIKPEPKAVKHAGPELG